LESQNLSESEKTALALLRAMDEEEALKELWYRFD